MGVAFLGVALVGVAQPQVQVLTSFCVSTIKASN